MRWLSAILTAMLLTLGPATVAGAEPGADVPAGSVTIALLESDRPADDDPRAQNYITDHLEPGQRVERTVQVANHTGAPAIIDVYTGPAALRDGEFTVGNRGDESMLTDWTAIDRPVLELDDGASAEVTVTIDVPADAPEGEQYGVVWAATAPVDDVDGEVQVVSRVGVRMYLSVGPGGAPAPGFTVGEVTADRDPDGNAAVTAEVHNTGGRAVDLTGDLSLTGGPGGLSAESVTAQTTTLAPGERGTVLFTVPDSAALPAGPWQAEVNLTSGHLAESADTELTFPASGDQAGEADGIAEWVWIMIAVAAALVVAGIGWTWTRRRGADTAGRPGAGGSS